MISRLASHVWHLVGGVRVWECSICHTCNPMSDVFCRQCCPVREPIPSVRKRQLSLFPDPPKEMS